MRILHFIHSLSSGGAEKMVALLSNAQSKLGHEVCVVQLTGEGTTGALFHRASLLPEVHHMALGMDSGPSPAAALKIRRALRDWHPDVMHMHSNVLPYLWPWLLAEYIPGTGRIPPVVWTMHNMPSRAAGGRIQRLLDSPWLRSGRVSVVTLSETCAREYEGIYGRRPYVVPNGLPPVTPTPAYAEVKEAVDAMRTSENTRVIVHAARFHPNKRPDRLFEALRRLEAQGADCALTVIGAGWDSPMAHRLLDSSSVRVKVVGEVSNPGDWIIASDALCLSSDTEGMPLCVIEALSCGVTPICTPAGGIPDMLTDGVTGYLASAADAGTLAEALARYLKKPLSPSLLKTHYSATYTLERCVDDYLDLYTDVMK